MPLNKVMRPSKIIKIFMALEILWKMIIRFSRKQTLFTIFLAIIVLTVNLASLLIHGFPSPRIHDEFSYLLQADTFSHFRLANPPHPMWEHFNSLRVLHHPAYAGNYPPAQSLFLALGIFLGHPIVGVYLSNVLYVCALFWMLCAWLPRRWAVLGVLIGWLHFGTVNYWVSTYWGGMVAAFAGCLVYGALKRLLQRFEIKYAFVFALGFSILANCRPYEGFLATLLTVFVLLQKSLTENRLRPLFIRVILPTLVVFLPTLLFMAYYNFRITGNAFLFPHVTASYNESNLPLFFWMPITRAAVHLSDPLMQRYVNEALMAVYQQKQSLSGLLNFCFINLQLFIQFYGWFLLIPLLFCLYHEFKNPWSRFAILNVGIIFIAGCLVSLYWIPHYDALFTCLMVYLIIRGLRRLYYWRVPLYPIGRIIFIYFLIFEISGVAYLYFKPFHRDRPWHIWRQNIIQNLNQGVEKHLILVQYDIDRHDVGEEWVYNGADIDHQKVIWAKDLGQEKNKNLLHYYHDRKVWLLNASADKPQPVSYSSS